MTMNSVNLFRENLEYQGFSIKKLAKSDSVLHMKGFHTVSTIEFSLDYLFY